jgi:hypothetical protein
VSLYHRDEPIPRDVDAHRSAISAEDAECLANGEPEELTAAEEAAMTEAFRALRVTWGT